MLAMCEDVDEQSFVYGERSGSYGRQLSLKLTPMEIQAMQSARAQVWRQFRGNRVNVRKFKCITLNSL